MLNKLRNLFKDEKGQDMSEYALLASLVSVCLVAVLLLLGPAIKSVFDAVIAAL